jgi:glucose/arabinose dehydrogenase
MIAAGPAAGVPAGTESVETSAGPVQVQAVAEDLSHPWGMAFLPDGRLLVTEKTGSLRIIGPDGAVSDPVPGTPEVFDEGQGGLMDVALAADFAESGHIYLSFAEPGPEGTAGTALGRGRLAEGRLEDFTVIFRQEPKVAGDKHFGNRIVIGPDGHVFLALGDRFQFEPAQDPSTHLGAIVRLNPDGSAPDDNPFRSRNGAQAALWSFGHRNIEAAAIDPATGHLWVAEMGPLGGDELNRPRAGANHGWPLVSWGRHYDGRDIPDPTTRPDLADAVRHWTPVISPSGMVFYTGDRFPAWAGSAFIGGLSANQLVRVVIDGETAGEEERIPLGARIRDVEQGPDGALYVLTDGEDGDLWRLTPMDVAER